MSRKIQKPEGLSEEASRFWDEYQTEMELIQTLYIKLALLGDVTGFEHLNMFVTLCSNLAGQYLEATHGTEQ